MPRKEVLHMPVYLKLIVSVLVAAVALVTSHFQSEAGLEANGWLALALGIAMIGAVWMFPEPRRDKRTRP